MVQKLQVKRLKVRISPIGLGGQVSLRTGWISQPQNKKHLKNKFNILHLIAKKDTITAVN